jgi:hypothetical protein
MPDPNSRAVLVAQGKSVLSDSPQFQALLRTAQITLRAPELGSSGAEVWVAMNLAWEGRTGGIGEVAMLQGRTNVAGLPRSPATISQEQ